MSLSPSDSPVSAPAGISQPLPLPPEIPTMGPLISSTDSVMEVVEPPQNLVPPVVSPIVSPQVAPPPPLPLRPAAPPLPPPPLPAAAPSPAESYAVPPESFTLPFEPSIPPVTFPTSPTNSFPLLLLSPSPNAFPLPLPPPEISLPPLESPLAAKITPSSPETPSSNIPPSDIGPSLPYAPALPPTVSSDSLPSPSRPVASVNTNPPASSKQSSVSVGVLVGCIAGVLFLLILGLLYSFCNDRKRRNHSTSSLTPKDYYKGNLSKRIRSRRGSYVITVEPEKSCKCLPFMDLSSGNLFSPRALYMALGFSSMTFTYDELMVATNGFSEANLIGQGGFGYVHKGILPGGKEIAVKKLMEGSSQGDSEFQAEVEIIGRVHHKHLVTLEGYCISRSERLLVYEFVPNKTLEFHLHGKGQPVMKWTTRVKIAIGSAKGLAYLHEDCNPTIIHRDIKASNILLDQNFEAKVSDFGLAKSFNDGRTSVTHVTTRVLGTFGYLAPEYASSGKLTYKSDVYSYGVMLLELITGCRPIGAAESLMKNGLVDWASPLMTHALEDGKFETFVDPRLGSNYNRSEMANMIACALACVHHSAKLRPRMSQIVRALEEGDISTNERNRMLLSLASSTYDTQQRNDEMNFSRMFANWQHEIRRTSSDSNCFSLEMALA